MLFLTLQELSESRPTVLLSFPISERILLVETSGVSPAFASAKGNM